MAVPHLIGLRFLKNAFVCSVQLVQGASTTSSMLKIKKKNLICYLRAPLQVVEVAHKVMNPSCNMYNLLAATAKDVITKLRKKRFYEYFCTHIGHLTNYGQKANFWTFLIFLHGGNYLGGPLRFHGFG
jgi:hypothetical protein